MGGWVHFRFNPCSPLGAAKEITFWPYELCWLRFCCCCSICLASGVYFAMCTYICIYVCIFIHIHIHMYMSNWIYVYIYIYIWCLCCCSFVARYASVWKITLYCISKPICFGPWPVTAGRGVQPKGLNKKFPCITIKEKKKKHTICGRSVQYQVCLINY